MKAIKHLFLLLSLTSIMLLVGCSHSDQSSEMQIVSADQTDTGDGSSSDNTDGGDATPVEARILASRTSCHSPCTVVFSAEGTTNNARNHKDTWRQLGYHFDFDDPSSGQYSTTNLSRNTQVGGPMAAHTFICPGPAQCVFNVGLRAESPEGHHDDDFVNIVVSPASLAFTPSNTICVSTSANFTGCPSGAAQTNALPAPTAYTGKRILLRRGDTFAPICIDYSAANVLVEPYGNPVNGRPVVQGISGLGVDGNCGAHIPSDADIGAIDGSTGYPEKWAHNITLTGLRMQHIAYGMSYTHVGIHDIDMEWQEESAGGTVSLAENTRGCQNNDFLTCANVPYPVGAYVSSVNIVQSDTEIPILGASPIGANIGAFNCPIINWLAVVETRARNAVEHNFRSEGTWRAYFGHNVFSGHHHRDPPAEGVRQKLTVRACGINLIDPQQTLYRHATTDIDGPMTRYLLVADNILGSTDDFGFGARVSIAPTKPADSEVLSFAIVERNTFLEPTIAHWEADPMPDPAPEWATDDVRLSGFNLSCRNNTESTPHIRNNCIDTGQNAVPAQWYEPAALNDSTPPTPDSPERL